MKMYRRAFTVVALVAAVAAALVSASTSGASRHAGASGGCCQVKGHYTLTVFADQGWVQPAEQELAKQFKRRTGITVQYNIVPDTTYQTLLTTKLNSGQNPGDIYMGQPSQAGLKITFQVQKHAVDLSHQPWVKNENPLTRAQATLNGKLYGQTIWDVASGTWIVVYNKTDFQKAGITSVPRTFAEFLAACAKLKAAGINPIYEPISDGWHHVLWFPENGPQMEKLDPGLASRLNKNTATFAGTPVILKAMGQLNTLYQSGYFGPTALTDTFANTVSAMSSGKYAMTVSSVTLPAQILAADPSVSTSNFGFMPMRILDNQYRSQNPGGPTKFVYKGGRHVAAALEYLDFLAETSSLNYAIKNEATTVTLDFKGVKAKWTPAQLAFVKAYPASPIPVYQVAVNYVNAQWSQMGTDIAAMFTGQETPLQVLQNIDNRRSQEAQQASDPHWP